MAAPAKKDDVWQLIVKVNAAKNLVAMDSSGTSDPYIKLTLGNLHTKTKTQKKSVNPVWKEDFIFEYPHNSSDTLTLTVMDKDTFSPDDFIGKTLIKLSSVKDEKNGKPPAEPEWMAVKGTDAYPAGMLEIQAYWAPKHRAVTGTKAQDATASHSLSDRIRGLVSKKKVRYTEDGFDLDLTYVLENMIAMGFPSEGLEGVYRNPMDKVQEFFKKYHDGHYKIYNLCSERDYDPVKFDNSVARFPFDDHNSPPLELIVQFCEDVHKFLTADPANVAAVHCKAGKGRTGLMVSAYLLFSKQCKTAADALQLFGERRTMDMKGVTIPSQQRYVAYFGEYLNNNYWPKKPFSFAGQPLILNKILLTTIPNFDVGGGSDPYIKVLNQKGKVIYNQKKVLGNPPHYQKKAEKAEWELDVGLIGDVKICFYDYDKWAKDDKMCAFWFHTGFVKNNHLHLTKKELDGAVKDKKHKKYNEKFTIDLYFKSDEAGLAEKHAGKHEDNSDLEPDNDDDEKDD